MKRAAALTLLLLAGIGGIAAPPAAAQSCQTLSALPYATYLDGSGIAHDLLLDLMLPGGAAPAPLVIWVHGGGWSSGSYTPIPDRAAALCSRGFAVASVEYRFSNVATWPAQIQDVRGAVRWLRAHAAQYGLDPDRFAAWGESAGGQLVSMLGTAGGVATATVGDETVDLEGTTGGNGAFSSRVEAVVDWYGATDFLQLCFYPTPSVPNHDAATSAESHLLGGPIQGRPERAATADPITYATADDPPFLLMHGTADKLYPFNQSELLYDALTAAGVPATLRPVPGAGHGGTLFDQSANLEAVYSFLQATLGTAGLPSVRIEATDSAAGEAGLDGATFTVRRTGATSAALTVRVIAGGTATPGTDYSTPAAIVTLPAGAASATVAVTPLDDLLAEGDETIVLTLAPDPAYRVEAASADATATLADDDGGALPVVSIVASDGAASEVGPDGGTFTVTRTGGTAADLTVHYAVSGTATPGADYAALSGTVLLPAGAASATLQVDPVADDPGRAESAETAIVTLSPGPDYALPADTAARSAGISIAAAAGPPIVSVSGVDRDAAEPGSNAGSFLVTRTGSTASPLTVTLAPSGTAQAGTDYTALPQSVTFNAGADRATLAVTPLDDFATEPTETVRLAVAADAALALGPYTGARVDLADDDVAGLPALAGVSVSPTSLTGGAPATGTVTLDRPAPAGGAVVSLSSSSPGAASPSSSVTVPAGATSAGFTVTTSPVGAATPVTLTASYRGLSRTAGLTVEPPDLSGITLTPTTVAGGCRTSTAKVTLTGKAPAGGIAVALASGGPQASVPSSVTVPAGSSSASVTVATSAVTASTPVAVTATLDGTSKSATLTVRPIGVAALALSPNPVVGPAPVTGTVTLECAAAPGDVAVAVTSSSNSVARPASSTVVVPAGQASADFSVTTADVASPSTANIRAAAAGIAKTVTLTVNP